MPPNLGYIIGIGFGAYLIGSIPFGLLIGKLNGVDVRDQGSGNIGATNVMRACGKGWGLTCFVLDFFKGFMPVYAVMNGSAQALFYRSGVDIVNEPDVGKLAIVALVGTVAGHVWPICLRFRGGKGVATSAGAATALAPVSVLAAFVVWLGVVLATRYMSLASMCAAVALPLSALAINQLRPGGIQPVPSSFVILFAAIAVLTVLRHRANIQRLLAGTENRLGKKVDVPTAEAKEDEDVQ